MSRHVIALIAVTLLVTACGQGKLPPQKVGKPYVINGESYYPSYDAAYDKTGVASWYGPGFHGKYTASGEVYDQNDLTAAHPTLPMPSLVRVTNLENGKSLIVRVNDRGPFKASRLIDLSKKSAQTLGIHSLAKVRVQFLEQETQNYIAMAKAKGGKIIPMSEYHRRAGEFETENQLVAEQLSEDIPTNTNAVAAPMMTVSQNEIASQDMPAPVVAAAEPKMKRTTPRLFVSEAAAEEVAAEPPQARIRINPNETITEMYPSAGAAAPQESNAPDDDIFQPDRVKEAAPKPLVEPSDDTPQPLFVEQKPKTVPAEVASDGKYTIQVGAFSSQANVDKLVKKLSPIGETMVDQIELGGKTVWRVRLGGFAERDYAADVLGEVRAIVPDAKIVRK